jgi:protease-4
MSSRRLLLATFGILLLCVAAGLLVRSCSGAGMPRVAGGSIVLDVDLDESYPEAPAPDGFATILTGHRTTLREVVETIDRAASDSGVAGLVARVGSSPGGMARAQELRGAIERFRSRGKFAWAFAETFGEAGNASEAYYLASACDQVWLQPSGDLWLTGVALQEPFLRGTLDKLGAEPVFSKRSEYKNAVNFYTERGFTEAHREALGRLKDSWFSQIVRGIAQSRKLSEDAVRAAIDRAPLMADEAVSARLVDGLSYRDEILRKALARAGGGSDLSTIARYRARVGKAFGQKKLALIYGVGEVTRGRGVENPLAGSVTMGSDSVAAAFRTAAADSDVRAIVFRVDSPGGSYVASDTINREVARAREKGKPVIVSMGDLAGSGGYMVSVSADKIVAQPGTITGSIGVFAGKFVLAGLFEKVGLSFDEVHSGEHALLWSPTRDFTPSERQRFDAWLDRIYADFTSKVAASRRLPTEKVLEIARGRIWTGEDALKIGLVDELGGFETAVRLAKVAGRIPARETVELVVYPKPKTFFETLRARMLGRPDPDDADASMSAAIRAIRPVARRLHALGLDGGNRGVLTMPPVEVTGDR